VGSDGHASPKGPMSHYLAGFQNYVSSNPGAGNH
jgi:hypothetical protein